MQRKTKEITLPESHIIIELNEWITGREAEYAEEPIYQAVQMSGTVGVGQDMGVKSIDTKMAVQESAHRDIEVYVSCIKTTEESGAIKEIKEPKQILEFILNQVPDADYRFIQGEIAKTKEASKKK